MKEIKANYFSRFDNVNQFRLGYFPIVKGDEPDPEPEDTVQGGGGEDELDVKKFSQRQVNAMQADHKRNLQAQNKKLIQQLEDLKKNKGISDEEREQLTAQIETLRSQYETETEKSKREKKKLETQYSRQVEDLTTERDTWRNRYHEETLQRALTDGAIAAKPYNNNPEPIIAILRPKTKLVEKVDDDGQPTGVFEAQVNYDTLSDGKKTTLTVPVEEAVKMMKEETDRFGHLFQGDGTGGLGLTNRQPGRNGKINYDTMTLEQYEKEVRPSIRGDN